MMKYEVWAKDLEAEEQILRYICCCPDKAAAGLVHRALVQNAPKLYDIEVREQEVMQ